MSDVVIFVGPPLIGRTRYYDQELCRNYHRVSATEVYSKDSSANLRIVIKNIVTELQKGHKIAIDDENVDRRTRVSYVNGISKKIPGTTFSRYQFVPLHHTAQLHICKEWCLARQALSVLCDITSGNIKYLNMCNVSSRIDSHPTMTKDLCLDADQYQLTKQLTVPLVCHSSYKLTCPLLITHWEGMVDSKAAAADSGSCLLRKGVCEAFNKWLALNNNGHIVIVCQSTSSVKKLMSSELIRAAHGVSLEHPINYVIIGDAHDPGQPPSTGLVVWLQYMFAASIYNKTSLYIYHSKSQQTCAQALSMKNIPATKVFSHPRSVNSVHYSERDTQPILHDVIYVRESSPSISSPRQPPESRYLPLYHLAELLEHSPAGDTTLSACYNEDQSGYSVEHTTDPELSCRHLCADVGAGRTLGVVYRDFESIERFQSSWQSSLEPVFDTTVNYLSQQEVDDSISGDTSGTLCADRTLHGGLLSRKGGALSTILFPKEEPSASQDSVVSATSNRSLPTWIQEQSQECELELPTSAPCKKPKYDLLSEPKPLTEAELLKTAEEVLSQHTIEQTMDTSTTSDSQLYSTGIKSSSSILMVPPTTTNSSPAKTISTEDVLDALFS